MSSRSQAILKTVFGYESFRGLQADVIESVLAGHHTLAVMPTGTGKSLCYQVPALALGGTTLVISPLIALMQDQVGNLRKAGVMAGALHSALTTEEETQTLGLLLTGQLHLLYISPERAVSTAFLEKISTVQIRLIAIDEAHCISQWGHDFRPDYLRLNALFQVQPQALRLALTATADGETQKDILQRLPLPGARLFLGGFDRPNIRYTIRQRQSENEHLQLLRFLQFQPKDQRGIVYCFSRRRVEDTAAWLVAQGYPASPYHAGLQPAVRQHHHAWFQKTDGAIMVATIAYGMGIDLPNIRYVVHLDLPKSIEAYYQETGRAGRDGHPAHAYMLFATKDADAQARFIERSKASPLVKATERQKLKALLDLCQTRRCRRQVMLEYFGDGSGPCGNCDTCLRPAPPPPPKSNLERAASALIDRMLRLRGRQAS